MAYAIIWGIIAGLLFGAPIGFLVFLLVLFMS